MTLKIGCFGSVLTFAPTREVCLACELRDACAKRVFDREPRFLEILRLRETDRGRKTVEEADSKALKDVTRYLELRRKRYLNHGNPRASRSQRDYQAMINNGIDFSLIPKGQNPFRQNDEVYTYMRHGVDFILKERVFKTKDIQEYLGSIGEYQNTNTARSHSIRIVSILMHSGVITKEGKVYCLPS